MGLTTVVYSQYITYVSSLSQDSLQRFCKPCRTYVQYEVSRRASGHVQLLEENVCAAQSNYWCKRWFFDVTFAMIQSILTWRTCLLREESVDVVKNGLIQNTESEQRTCLPIEVNIGLLKICATISRSGRSHENIATVRESVDESPRTSSSRRLHQLHMPKSTLHDILKKVFNLPIKSEGHSQRSKFMNLILKRSATDELFCKKITMSDVSKQNYRIHTRSSKYTHASPLHHWLV